MIDSLIKAPAKTAVIFDLDGVVVDNMDYHKKAWALFLKSHAPHIDLDSFACHFGKSNRDLMTILFGAAVTNGDVLRLGEEKEAIYRKIYQPFMRPLPGLIPLLRELRVAGIRSAVASAAPRINVDFVLDGTGCREFFDVVLDITASPKGKPDPGIYLEAAGRLDIPPRRCLVFEDSPPGIAAASAAGMTVIGVTTSYDEQRLEGTAASIGDFRTITVEAILEHIN